MEEPQTSEKSTNLDHPDQFPQLVFKSAGWLLGCWGDRVVDNEVTDERRAELLDKLPLLQKAVAAGQETGGTETLPRDIVAHEYEVLKRSVGKVFTRIADTPMKRRHDLLRGATCDYCVRPTTTNPYESRPLFFGKTADEIESLALSIATRSVEPAKLAHELTANLFAIGAARIKKRLSRVRKEGDRFHKVPTQGQRFLVAWFMIQARHGDDRKTEGRLLVILDALFHSRYDAKGVYHLARYVSTLPEDVRVSSTWQCKPEVCWETVEQVCDHVIQEANERADP